MGCFPRSRQLPLNGPAGCFGTRGSGTRETDGVRGSPGNAHEGFAQERFGARGTGNRQVVIIEVKEGRALPESDAGAILVEMGDV